MKFTPEHGTKILPLRWLANYIFHPISYYFLKNALRRHYQLEDIKASEKQFNNDFVLKYSWKLYHLFDKPYSWWGTYYK